MTTTDTIVLIVAGVLMATGVLAAIVVDLRAHEDRPALDRLWLVLPVVGLVVLAVAAVSR